MFPLCQSSFTVEYDPGTASVGAVLNALAQTLSLDHVDAFALFQGKKIGASRKLDDSELVGTLSPGLSDESAFVIRPAYDKPLDPEVLNSDSRALEISFFHAIDAVSVGAWAIPDISTGFRLAALRIHFENGNVDDIPHLRAFLKSSLKKILPPSIIGAKIPVKIILTRLIMVLEKIKDMNPQTAMKTYLAIVQSMPKYGISVPMDIVTNIIEQTSGKITFAHDGIVYVQDASAPPPRYTTFLPFGSIRAIRPGSDNGLASLIFDLIPTPTATDDANVAGASSSAPSDPTTTTFWFETEVARESALETIMELYSLCLASSSPSPACKLEEGYVSPQETSLPRAWMLYESPSDSVPAQGGGYKRMPDAPFLSRVQVFKARIRERGSRAGLEEYGPLLERINEADDAGIPLVELELSGSIDVAAHLEHVGRALIDAYRYTPPFHRMYFREDLRITMIDMTNAGLGTSSSALDSLARFFTEFGGSDLESVLSIETLLLPGNGLTGSAWGKVASALRALTPLHILDVSHNAMGDVGMDVLCSAINDQNGHLTKEWRASHCDLGVEGAKAAARRVFSNTTMEVLDLSYNGMNDKGVVEILEALERGRAVPEVNLSGNDVGGSGATKIMLNSLTGERSSIRAWLLDDADVSSKVVSALADQVATGLVKLSINNAKAGKKALAPLLEHITTRNSLCVLGLAGNKLDSGFATEFAASLGSSSLSSLTALNMADNKLGTDGVCAILDALSSNSSLYSLNLANNKAGKDVATSLASSLERNISLKKLNLSGSSFGDDGASAMAHALAHDRVFLQVLRLDGCKIGDKGFRDIFEALGTNSRLTTLFLQSNKLKPEPETKAALLAMIETTESLEVLNIVGNHSKTVRWLPQCKIAAKNAVKTTGCYCTVVVE